jgi:putative transposase
MVGYRRNRVPGGTYFFTVTLRDRRTRTLTDHVMLLREAMRSVRERHPFTIDAIVILPEHLHALWTLPAGDADYSGRWRALKAEFARAVAATGLPLRRTAKGEILLWQRRFWEHTIRNDGDFARHVDYIHFNPVKHGHVARVADWPFSSFHRFVDQGLLPADWGSGYVPADGDYGDR